ncbi:MAG: HD domain-containing protein [Bryobacteraceae bacterium]
MIDILPQELPFVDSPLFQRLRGVHQTSLALLTYPCAGHSRSEHSLGCLAVADRVLRALARRIPITDKDRLIVRLAALLHDCAHGPFSHTSEVFYESNPIFSAVKAAHPVLFERASASEMLTYSLITSKPFGRIWDEMLSQYQGMPPYGGLLSGNDRWLIATMIVGSDFNSERPDASPGPEHRFLRQLINGPFDVDKLDYVARDGYFTGLNLAIDVERLLWVLDTIEFDADEGGRKPRVLCVSASGATVLEQILFSKMQLYSSVYHHHKVRAAHQAILRLFTSLEKAQVRPQGLPLDDPATYLRLQDADILHACFQGQATAVDGSDGLLQAQLLTREIQDRTLPMRALVLTHPVWGVNPRCASDTDRKKWEAKMKAPGQPDRFAAEVAAAAGLATEDVWVDIPGPAPLEGTAQEGIVKFDDQTYIAIGEMFPIGGWLSGYQAYRTMSYIFARRSRKEVGRAARQILSRDYDITTNEVSWKLAKAEE